ncbi:hypothetical protein PCE1_004277 [Barthelona sp. PCE]
MTTESPATPGIDEFLSASIAKRAELRVLFIETKSIDCFYQYMDLATECSSIVDKIEEPCIELVDEFTKLVANTLVTRFACFTGDIQPTVTNDDLIILGEKAFALCKTHVRLALKLCQLYEAKQNFEDCERILDTFTTTDASKTKLVDDEKQRITAEKEKYQKELLDKGITTVKNFGRKWLGKIGIDIDQFKLQPTAEGGYSLQYGDGSNQNQNGGFTFNSTS